MNMRRPCRSGCLAGCSAEKPPHFRSVTSALNALSRNCTNTPVATAARWPTRWYSPVADCASASASVASGSQRNRPSATSWNTFSRTSRPSSPASAAGVRSIATEVVCTAGLSSWRRRLAIEGDDAAGDAVDHRAQLHVRRWQHQRLGQAVAQPQLAAVLRQRVVGRDHRAQLLRPGADLLHARRRHALQTERRYRHRRRPPRATVPRHGRRAR